MRVPEGKHEPSDFVTHIEIPAALESVQRLQGDADADENKKRPPTKTNMFISRIVHIKSALILMEGHALSCPKYRGADGAAPSNHSARTTGFSSRSLRNFRKTSVLKTAIILEHAFGWEWWR